MRVRFPTGVTLNYPQAKYATRKAEFTDLYTKQDGDWVAQIPNSCVIEVQPASRVHNAVNDPGDVLSAALALIERRDPSLSSHDLGRIKVTLQDFNARRRRWK